MTQRRAGGCGIALAVLAAATACAGLRPGVEVTSRPPTPGVTITETLDRAIALLEDYQCATFAVEFLSPIRREQIEDLEAFREQRACSPDDRGNLDDVLLALRLARLAEPQRVGVRAIFDLSGIGIAITRLELVRYVDGRWYFNDF